ncbi:MAG: hypothetical protein IKP65_03305 [Alphaproteobacteria bacterium]|nr:hypothetical protein [Alphaproteobacteria bacterium]
MGHGKMDSLTMVIGVVELGKKALGMVEKTKTVITIHRVIPQTNGNDKTT